MKNCHKDIVSFHNDEVTLRQSGQTEMRERRDSNRTQLKSGLKRDDEPEPGNQTSQGSYAMRTMVQDVDSDYDIDDGVYFSKSDLVGPRGGDRTPADAKEMVRKAVHRESFKRAPDVRTNCVRVYYEQGYHVDLPVYRSFEEGDETVYELASTRWKQSDPQKVTSWFSDTNIELSPDEENGRQMRRVTRLLKKYSKSRSSWKSRIASGFAISKLVTEEYLADEDREDESLYQTMLRIRNRLEYNLEVRHPVLDEYLTSDSDDAKTRFLKEKLTEALDTLNPLFDPDCTQKEARKAWGKVFSTSYFDELPADEESEGSHRAASNFGILIAGNNSDVVDKRGGDGYA